ncbi:hypothetical protein N0V91_002649 [Didymella pomorum]|uniref:Uncharacterized protein n=1 Tax=Didymella pomorum TaxID=749634 RepID=A0A9W8ZJX2_9PLEO|nr:hypothetical protein N0V91_002649 [Didymella pomorum]
MRADDYYSKRDHWCLKKNQPHKAGRGSSAEVFFCLPKDIINAVKAEGPLTTNAADFGDRHETLMVSLVSIKLIREDSDREEDSDSEESGEQYTEDDRIIKEYNPLKHIQDSILPDLLQLVKDFADRTVLSTDKDWIAFRGMLDNNADYILKTKTASTFDKIWNVWKDVAEEGRCKGTGDDKVVLVRLFARVIALKEKERVGRVTEEYLTNTVSKSS